MLNIKKFKEELKQRKRSVYTITTINEKPEFIAYGYYKLDDKEVIFPFPIELIGSWKYSDIDTFTEDDVDYKWDVPQAFLELPDKVDSIEIFEIDTLEKEKEFLKAILKRVELYNMYLESKKIIESQK